MESSERRERETVPLGIYVHAPFCVSHCTYCDFFTRPFTGETEVRRFVDALVAEMAVTAAALNLRGRKADTFYFGGGTPSLLPPRDLDRILERARNLFSMGGDAEVSLEANPESVTREKMRAYRESGVNRISLGVQSFQRSILETLGRAHGPAQAARAVTEIRDSGFSNLSLDLMLALPGQTRAGLEADLDAAVDLEPEHLSAYLLEMDKESALRVRIERGELAPPSQEEAAEMYETACTRLEGSGFRHYRSALRGVRPFRLVLFRREALEGRAGSGRVPRGGAPRRATVTRDGEWGPAGAHGRGHFRGAAASRRSGSGGGGPGLLGRRSDRALRPGSG